MSAVSAEPVSVVLISTVSAVSVSMLTGSSVSVSTGMMIFPEPPQHNQRKKIDEIRKTVHETPEGRLLCYNVQT